MKDSEYGKLIKKYRQEAGYTLDEFAELIEKSKRTLQNYESGKTTVPHTIRKKIENLLDFGVFVLPQDISMGSDELLNRFIYLSCFILIEKMDNGYYFVQKHNEERYRILTESEYYTFVTQVSNYIVKLIETHPLLPEEGSPVVDPRNYKGKAFLD